MELLAVVAIIVIIAGAAVIAVPGIIDGVKRDRAKTDCKTLEKAITGYSLQNPDVTLTEGQWTELTAQGNNQKAILEAAQTLDPWGRPYHWTWSNPQSTTGRPLVYSQGPDGGNRITNMDK